MNFGKGVAYASVGNGMKTPRQPARDLALAKFAQPNGIAATCLTHVAASDLPQQ